MRQLTLGLQNTLTSSPLTRDFRHILSPIKLHGYGIQRRLREPYRGVTVRDRIKHWNIVPGDKVRIISGPNADKDSIRQVASVDKLTNRVFIKGLPQRGSNPDNARLASEHYSNLQLLVGRFEVPSPVEASTKAENVWATRLSTSKPFYVRKHGLWIWNRYAASTSIELPSAQSTQGRKNRVKIPWPKSPKAEKKASLGMSDTSPEDALAITWRPFHPKDIVDLTSLEHLYIQSLHPDASFFVPNVGQRYASESNYQTIDPCLPMEVFLSAELSNPHSRTKKQARWQERERLKLALRNRFIAQELERARRTGPGNELGGRRVRPSEARRIAEWKWKLELRRQATDDRYRSWVAWGGLEQKKRRQERSVRKLRRQQERLRELVLREEKNQVVPGPYRT
ncbi:hypothetical protein FRB99_006299 [Tulasnella sp. 403]|nr:hypothetical protein FRB99_006299 [Tulasnella sp. 403]